MTNNQTRDALINSVHGRAADNKTGVLFPVSYDTQTGASHGGEASAALGAMFDPMALNLPVKIESGSGHPKDEGSGSNVGAIAGGVVGGVAAIALVILAIFFWRRRQQKKKEQEEEQEKYYIPTEAHDVAPYEYAPVVPRTEIESSVSQHGTTSAALPPGAMQVNSAGGSESEFSNGGYGYATTTPQAPPLPRKGSSTTVATQSHHVPTQPASSSTGPASSHEPTDSGGPDLRNEVEQLRREMEEMRAQGVTYEAPPQYGQ